MNKLLPLALILLLAVPSLAQSELGITFEEDMIVNSLVFGIGAFSSYVYIQTDEAMSIAAYECSIELSSAQLFVLNVTGPNGWTNFGDGTNHLVGFQTPLPVGPDGWVVVCTMDFLLTEPGTWIVLEVGAATPSSFDPPTPGFANGINPDILVPCSAQSGYINDEFAVEGMSLTQVKALFD